MPGTQVEARADCKPAVGKFLLYQNWIVVIVAQLFKFIKDPQFGYSQTVDRAEMPFNR